MGRQGRGRKPYSERREPALALRAKGLSLSGIATALGCTRQGVHYLLTVREPRRHRQPLRCTTCGRPLGALGLPGPEGLCLPCLKRSGPVTVREWLRAYRLAAGLSQRAAGLKAGVGVGSVAGWERGSCRPRPRSLRRPAWALGVAPSMLDPQRGEEA
jgi:hypothetical protein